jgi:hypothetical protein
MADSGDVYDETAAEEGGDISMTADTPVVEIGGSAARAATEDTPAEGADDTELAFQDEAMEDAPPRVTYIDYLKSPVIGLLVGQGDEQALLTAHQALLTTSPWFKDACDKFSDVISVSNLQLQLR